VLASLLAAQDAADDAGREASARGRAARDHSTHSRIALLGGAARGVRLLSGRGDNTRPMMAKVKAALFDMLLCGSPAGPGYFPDGATWLDLFAGTGSVGLEAVSRGAARAEFVEMDPWVVANVLSVNAAAVLSACEGDDAAPASTTRIHTMTAQAFLASHTGPGFDYVSVCPPYVKVEYGELLRQVEASNVLHAHSVVVVEYPARAAGVMPATLGGLERVRDRRYGRTNVAVYGPGG
jgi:16S rRNA (guanine(966)-N(2))-methyltransferase RsmD